MYSDWKLDDAGQGIQDPFFNIYVNENAISDMTYLGSKVRDQDTSDSAFKVEMKSISTAGEVYSGVPII